jgi:hypothetical protein
VEKEQRQEWSQLQGLEQDDDDRTDVASADTDAEAELVKQGNFHAAATPYDSAAALHRVVYTSVRCV